MSNKTIKDINVVMLDREGVGRSQTAAAMLRTKEDFKEISIMAVGIHTPDSGRTDVHPDVVVMVQRRCQIDLSKELVHQLEPDMITNNTIVIVLTQEIEDVPSYVMEKAYAVLQAPIGDPFPKLDKALEPAATYISFYMWLLEQTLINRLAEIGKRDTNGLVVPRFLIEFQPQEIEPSYEFDSWGLHAYPQARR